jgi:hypothetical protein
MTAERFVVLGLARPGADWFREAAHWATDAVLGMEFVKCVSVDELRTRLSSGRHFSAVVVDGRVVGIDRDLLGSIRAAGVSPLVIDHEPFLHDWLGLGADTVLDPAMSPRELGAALHEHTEPVTDIARRVSTTPTLAAGWQAPLIAVLGAPGAGTSTVAIAAAQGLAADARNTGAVLLADFALDADLAFFHDVGDVVPGLPELVEAHRLGQPARGEIDRLLHHLPAHGYNLLLGVRRHRDWAVLRPRAFEAALQELRRGHRVVVADIDADLEGVDQCGSIDVEERNLLARTAIREATVVVVVGLPTAKGLHSLVRVLQRVIETDTPPRSIVSVINRAPRSPRARSSLTSALADLLPTAASISMATSVFIPERRRLDEVVRDAAPLPSALVRPVVGAIEAGLRRQAGSRDATVQPQPVEPGSLGHWSDEDVAV